MCTVQFDNLSQNDIEVKHHLLVDGITYVGRKIRETPALVSLTTVGVYGVYRPAEREIAKWGDEIYGTRRYTITDQKLNLMGDPGRKFRTKWYVTIMT
jgi:hypothetical protein